MYTVEDAFYVTGRGHVFAVKLMSPKKLPIRLSIQDVPEEDQSNTIESGDKITFGDGEEYTVIGVERFRNSMGPSNNIGILVLGDLRNDKNTYHGRTFEKVEVSKMEYNAKQRARIERQIEKLTKQIADLNEDSQRVQSLVAKEVIDDAIIDAKGELRSYELAYPKYNDGEEYQPQN